MKRDAEAVGVTRLEPAHRDAWTALWTRYLALLGYDAAAAPRAVWSRLIAAGDLGGLVAWSGGEMAGFLLFARHAHPWAEGPVWLITDVFTDERLRGRGVARSLLEAAFAQATAEGAAWAWGGVGAHNAAARTAYAQLAEEVGQTLWRRML